MRISKEAIRKRVEYLNGKQGYNITVFERQGLYSRLTVKKYGTELICKVLSNKEIWDRVTVIDNEINANKENITIVIIPITSYLNIVILLFFSSTSILLGDNLWQFLTS